MLCRKPYVTNGIAHGCGQCLPCRIKKQTEWAHRIELEAMTHEQSCFITLTYNTEHLPVVSELNPIPSLKPRDATLWLKRLREAVYPIPIRYFLVGEYGTKGSRPHYHVCIFGLGGCHYGRTRRIGNGTTPRQDCCPNCQFIARTWSDSRGPIGNIEIGELNQKTANYTARYTLKKMTQKDDHRLAGAHPEFTRMSKQKGGLGIGMVPEIASTLLAQPNFEAMKDAPPSLLHGRKQKPLGRYLRRKIRLQIGMDEKTPQSTLDQQAEKMQPLRTIAFHHSKSFSKTIADHHEQAALNQETKLNLFKRNVF